MMNTGEVLVRRSWAETVRRYSLIMLSVGGWFAFGSVGAWSVSRHHGFDMLLAAFACIVYVIWQISESYLSKAEIAQAAAPHDRSTTEMAVVAKALLMAAVFVPASGIDGFLAVIGILVLCFGIHLRWRAIRKLGSSYTTRIRVPQGGISRTGPYGVIRHPAYLGTLLAHLGIVLVFANVYSVLAWVLLWVPVVIARVQAEERLLAAEADYRTYMDEVRFRLVKGVW